MKLLLVWHIDGRLDEGARNLGHHLAKEMSYHLPVITLDLMSTILNVNRIRKFKPDIIHLLVDPSNILSFFLARMLKLCNLDAKTVMSAVHLGPITLKHFISYLRPDLVLVQSVESEKFFRKFACRTDFLPNGVDTNKFLPATHYEKLRLRKKYEIPLNKIVVLHVGPIRSRRNILVLKELQQYDMQVIIVGRKTDKIDYYLLNDLREAGCIIWTDFIKNIEEIYALSDCYVFPVVERKSAIEIPLSVLEAMSCNLPVVTTRFGALTRIFDEGNGLFYTDRNSEFKEKVCQIAKKETEVWTRSKVMKLSWSEVGRRLVEIYDSLLCNS